MLHRLVPFLKHCFLVFLFSYGVFYTSYKYGQPELGNKDFFKYEKMVDSPLHLGATTSPHILRQIPTLVAYAIKQTGIFYPNKIAFTNSQKFEGENMQRNFFALILSNYLAYIIAIALLIGYLLKAGGYATSMAVYLPVIAFSLGYFMVPVNIIAPMSQGYGWLVAVLLSIGVFSKNYLYIVAGSLLAIFSRETTLLFFTLLLAAHAVYHIIYKSSNSFTYRAFAIMLALFICLLLIRTGYTNGNERQFSPAFLLEKTLDAATQKEYFFQAFLTQGLLFFLLGLAYIKEKKNAVLYLCAAICIVLIGGFGAGRILGESFPYLVLLYLLPKNEKRAVEQD